mmetsp:Transcript_22090/g.52816  ORF Transcript_22090/g.52816 Transcript_22090/m.52816 type:complete len:407 (+) Transcript_22090:423-1643(+)
MDLSTKSWSLRSFCPGLYCVTTCRRLSRLEKLIYHCKALSRISDAKPMPRRSCKRSQATCEPSFAQSTRPSRRSSRLSPPLERQGPKAQPRLNSFCCSCSCVETSKLQLQESSDGCSLEEPRRAGTLDKLAKLARCAWDLGLQWEVGLNPDLVDARAARRLVLGDGDGDRGAVAEGDDRLDDALAESALPRHERPPVVLEGAREDLRGARGAAVHEHRDGALVVDGAEVGRVDVAYTIAVGDEHDLPRVDEQPGHLDAGGEEPSAVVAEVEHVALRAARLELPQGVLGRRRGVAVEGREADVAEPPGAAGGLGHGAAHPVRHRDVADPFAGEPHGPRAAAAAAAPRGQHQQLHLAALVPLQPVRRLVERHPLSRDTVDLQDRVLGPDPGPICWAVRSRGHHEEAAV